MASVSGIECTPAQQSATSDISQSKKVDLWQHTRLTAIELLDCTDIFNELVHERKWLLHPSEKLQLQGNLFVFENVLDQSGLIALKCGPLPTMRAVTSPWDVRVLPEKGQKNFTAFLFEDQTYPWQIIPYHGGLIGQTRALHQAQRQHMASSEINFLSNTWGDRSQDSRLNEAFILAEIDHATQLGVEVVQLDDGWQQGRTANSVEAAVANGRWEGFHDSENDFWKPDPVRFPNGLEPLMDAAQKAGLALGLWYAPDSAHDFSNWQTDVKTVMHLHQRYGVRHFKFDSINIRNRTGEINLNQFFDALHKQANAQIIVDMDITAGCRPGYFGKISCGPLFVTNRYTDWPSYWPHHTLRTLWQLCHWIDPIRIRMLFLNHARNTQNYPNDPLAPQHITPTTMFAPLMFCQPLGWFEISNLPKTYFQQIKPLVELWKQHRQAIHAGTVLPVGHPPDGVAWSGFVSVSEDRKSGYLLVCNGMQSTINLSHDLPDVLNITQATQLAGEGVLTCQKGLNQLTQIKPQSFWFGKVTLI